VPLGGTVPTPLLIVAFAALAEVHVKVVLAPAVIVVGAAANVTVGAAGVAAKPTQPVNKAVVELSTRTSTRKR
jgi:hypothetical protein